MADLCNRKGGIGVKFEEHSTSRFSPLAGVSVRRPRVPVLTYGEQLYPASLPAASRMRGRLSPTWCMRP